MEKEAIETQVEEIDRQFRDKGIPPYRRPIAAIVEFGRRNKISLPIVVTELPGSPIGYPKENEPITTAIHDWYTKQYGDALNVDFSPGSTVVEVLGNLFELRMPKIWGSAHIIWHSNFDLSKKKENIIGKGPIAINVAECIQQLTPIMAKKITDNEKQRILRWFTISLETFDNLSHGRKTWINKDQILTNIDSSCRYLISQRPNFGESLWASLQATEKAIKSELLMQGQSPKWSHNLINLAENLSQYSNLNTDLLQYIQCSAGVRYGEESVDIERAKKAHYSMIKFIHALMELPA